VRLKARTYEAKSLFEYSGSNYLGSPGNADILVGKWRADKDVGVPGLNSYQNFLTRYSMIDCG